MGYTITAYTRAKAKSLGVKVRRSTNSKKKIDVFKMVKNAKGKSVEKKVGSVGAIGYGDYPTFMKTKGKEFANKRRTAYKKRHQKYRNIKGTNSYYADKLLW